MDERERKPDDSVEGNAITAEQYDVAVDMLTDIGRRDPVTCAASIDCLSEIWARSGRRPPKSSATPTPVPRVGSVPPQGKDPSWLSAEAIPPISDQEEGSPSPNDPEQPQSRSLVRELRARKASPAT